MATRETEEIAATDAYAREMDATVVEVLPEGVVLDRTVFYARGGGQPGDMGWLRWEGGEARVSDTTRVGRRPLHAIEGEAPPFGAGRPRRDRLGPPAPADANPHGGARPHRDHLARLRGQGDGQQPRPGRRPDGLRAGDHQRGVRAAGGGGAEQGAGRRPAGDRAVLPRREAMADPDLIRTKVNLIPQSIDPIRVIDIEGLDRQADGGTHVRSTGEVGTVRVVRTDNKGKTFRRIRIALAESGADPSRGIR